MLGHTVVFSKADTLLSYLLCVSDIVSEPCQDVCRGWQEDFRAAVQAVPQCGAGWQARSGPQPLRHVGQKDRTGRGILIHRCQQGQRLVALPLSCPKNILFDVEEC